VGGITLPRNLLEKQFDDLDLEHNFETGIKDTAENVEKLSDYADSGHDGDYITRYPKLPIVSEGLAKAKPSKTN
jgi:hypothetical protein